MSERTQGLMLPGDITTITLFFLFLFEKTTLYLTDSVSNGILLKPLHKFLFQVQIKYKFINYKYNVFNFKVKIVLYLKFICRLYL